jgi:hypothetical protein
MAAIQTTIPEAIEERQAHRSVTVLRLPPVADLAGASALAADLRHALDRGRPLLVLDGSAIRQPEMRHTLLLLECLEIAMMRSGDARLAAMPEGLPFLCGLTARSRPGDAPGRLFDVFDTVEEAILSYHGLSPALAAAVAPARAGLAGPGLAGAGLAEPCASGPSASGPSASGPSASGPSASGPSASGPSASGPSASGARASGDRTGQDTISRISGGGAVGGGAVRTGSVRTGAERSGAEKAGTEAPNLMQNSKPRNEW